VFNVGAILILILINVAIPFVKNYLVRQSVIRNFGNIMMHGKNVKIISEIFG